MYCKSTILLSFLFVPKKSIRFVLQDEQCVTRHSDKKNNLFSMKEKVAKMFFVLLRSNSRVPSSATTATATANNKYHQSAALRWHMHTVDAINSSISHRTFWATHPLSKNIKINTKPTRYINEEWLHY